MSHIITGLISLKKMKGEAYEITMLAVCLCPH
jgi:hypothetical protein